MQLILGVDALVPHLTGIGRYTWELARRLDNARGVTPHYYRNGEWVALNGQRCPGIVSHLPSAVRRCWVSRLGRTAVFHGPNYFVPNWAERSIATIHDLSVFKFPETHPVERVRDFERRFSESIRRARVLLTDSATTRSEVVAYTGVDPKRVISIPLGVGQAYRPMNGEQWRLAALGTGLSYKGYVLCVSTLDPRKNIDKLLAAYQYLPDAVRRNYPLVLIGANGWAGDDLHRALDVAAAQGWLRRLGYISEAQLPALFAGAALFVFPSKYEGFGLPVAEAMACGVPVIASDIEVLREVSLGIARYVDPVDTHGFAAMIEFALSERSFSLAALEAVERVIDAYNWGNCFERTFDVYRRVLEA